MTSGDWRCSLLIGVIQIVLLADKVNVFIIDDVIMILILLQRLQFYTGQNCRYIMDKRASILLFCFR